MAHPAQSYHWSSILIRTGSPLGLMLTGFADSALSGFVLFLMTTFSFGGFRVAARGGIRDRGAHARRRLRDRPRGRADATTRGGGGGGGRGVGADGAGAERGRAHAERVRRHRARALLRSAKTRDRFKGSRFNDRARLFSRRRRRRRWRRRASERLRGRSTRERARDPRERKASTETEACTHRPRGLGVRVCYRRATAQPAPYPATFTFRAKQLIVSSRRAVIGWPFPPQKRIRKRVRFYVLVRSVA